MPQDVPQDVAEPDTPTAADTRRIVLVTGPSGAGRTTAIRVLEDLGFEAIDNLPLGLLPRLFKGPPHDKSLVLGVDARNRDFSPEALLEALSMIDRIDGPSPELLFIDCRPNVLLRRYSETRRRHPMAPSNSPEDGIRRELALLTTVRDAADLLLDTSEMSPHDLRRSLEKWFAADDQPGLAIEVQSFSYKRGLPATADMVLDCRFLSNPHWVDSLRAKDGRDPSVADHVRKDPRFAEFFAGLKKMANMLLPAYVSGGRSHFTIAFGCTGGRHRSVFITESLAEALADQGWRVSIRHRELDRELDQPTRAEHRVKTTADEEDSGT